MWNKKKVVVTGGSGFLGSFLCRRLHQLGADVIAPKHDDYDLLDDYNVKTIIKPCIDHVFHLAAVVGGIGANQARPYDFFARNTQINMNVVETCYARSIPLTAVGSVCAYPETCPVPFVEENLFNGYPEPTNAPYGISKRALLVQMQSAKAEEPNLRWSYLIPTNLYGPGDTFNTTTSHVIPAIIVKIQNAIDKNLDTVTLWGTGHASRDFLYVEDCVDALILAAEKVESPTPINLGTGNEMPIFALAHLIAKLMEFNPDYIQWDDTKPDGQKRRSLNWNKAKYTLGWKPKTDIPTGLQETIAWYRMARLLREASNV